MTTPLHDLVALERRIDERFDRLERSYLERSYYFHVGARFGKWLRNPQIVNGPDWLEAGDDAAENGTISEADMRALCSADMLVQGVAKKPTGLTGDVVFAVEISLTIDDHDVERAAARAAILRRVGYQAAGFVGGETVTRGATVLAERENVIIDLCRP